MYICARFARLPMIDLDTFLCAVRLDDDDAGTKNLADVRF